MAFVFVIKALNQERIGADKPAPWNVTPRQFEIVLRFQLVGI
jgi:hypothetical protein